MLDEPCLYATCPVRVGGWNVVVRRTKADAMRSAKAGLVRSILLGCVGSAVIGTLLLLLFRAIGRRVRTAADAADRIARGDLTRSDRGIGRAATRPARSCVRCTPWTATSTRWSAA